MPHRYLATLPLFQREVLAEVNAPGLAELRRLLTSGEGVAFLGAGVSAPLYPTWDDLISQLIDHASPYLSKDAVRTCQRQAAGSPDAVAEFLRRHLHPSDYAETLRAMFRQRQDPISGKTWTATQELITRCNFRGIITTNYDPGLLNARLAVRPGVSSTGFASWIDDDALDRWGTGEVFKDDELPVLYAHGQHNQPRRIVLATSEYAAAYEGHLPRLMNSLFAHGHLVWLGFSFRDPPISAILKQLARNQQRGLRHVAILPWDPGTGHSTDPQDIPDDLASLRSLVEIQLGARAVYYPTDGTSHEALGWLLEDYVDPRITPVLGASSQDYPRKPPTATDRGGSASVVAPLRGPNRMRVMATCGEVRSHGQASCR